MLDFLLYEHDQFPLKSMWVYEAENVEHGLMHVSIVQVVFLCSIYILPHLYSFFFYSLPSPAVWSGVQGGDIAKCDKKCYPEWPFNYPHCSASTHPGLSLLHHWLPLPERWLYHGGWQVENQDPCCRYFFYIKICFQHINFSVCLTWVFI